MDFIFNNLYVLIAPLFLLCLLCYMILRPKELGLQWRLRITHGGLV